VPAVLAAGIALAGSPAQAATLPVAPLVMAHKGLHYPYGTAPENSVPAIEAAAARGLPSEIDILLSKGTKSHPFGVPFVFHDQTLDRMTNRSGYVHDFTPDQLAHTCLVTVPRTTKCSTSTIPRLTKVLNHTRAAGGALDIEIKHQTLTWNQALVIVKRLEWADVWSWDLLAGFDSPLILCQWTQPLAELRKVAEHRGDPPLLTEFLSVVPDYSPENTAGNAMEAVYFRNMNADVVNQLHALNLKADVYTTNDSTDWDKFRAAGVDWVISDNVLNYQKWAQA
jgi:glycerophosphoryl diester phosphodiesterase